MPKLLKIPTDEEQQDWEENDLYPNMFSGIIDEIRRDTIEGKKMDKRIAKLKAERLAYEALQLKEKENKTKDKTKIIEDVKEMIKNTETKKKKKHSSDINVTQEYDKLLNDLDQLQKTKKKRKMIDEVTSMLDIPKIKKTSNKSKVIDDTFDMLSNIPRVKKSSSKKTKEIGDTLISMMDTQLTKPPKKEPISIDNLLLDIDKSIKQKKTRAKRDKISEKVTDLLSTQQPEIKDTKVLVKASKKAKKIIDAIDKHT